MVPTLTYDTGRAPHWGTVVRRGAERLGEIRPVARGFVFLPTGKRKAEPPFETVEALKAALEVRFGPPPAALECPLCKGWCIDNQGRDCLRCGGSGTLMRVKPVMLPEKQVRATVYDIPARGDLPGTTLHDNTECPLCKGWCIDNQGRDCLRCGGSGTSPPSSYLTDRLNTRDH